MRFIKIKAGALQLTLFITVVIALLLGAFILILHTHKTFKTQSHFTIAAIKNTDIGIEHLLTQNIHLSDTVVITDHDSKILKGHTGYWGMYEKLTVSSTIKNKTFYKSALAGGQQNTTQKTALYLEEHHKPLVVVGNTKIRGNVYLPSQGVRTGNISGHSYYQDQLIYGSTKTSGELPKTNKDLLASLKKLPRLNHQLSENTFIDFYTKNEFQNSFHQPLQIIYEKNTIHIQRKRIIGHIIIQSETKIIVEATSHLQDVILIAPIIEINDKVKGVFQAIASQQIKVGNDCYLAYPSTLVLQEGIHTSSIKNSKKTIPISIQENSKIHGLVAYLGNEKNYDPQLSIASNTFIKGEVYCTQNLELTGTVYGTVYTSNFVAQQNGSSYQNHLYNGQIIADSLPTEYVGLTFETSKKGIAEWLY